jgi:hypothetical protein
MGEGDTLILQSVIWVSPKRPAMRNAENGDLLMLIALEPSWRAVWRLREIGSRRSEASWHTLSWSLQCAGEAPARADFSRRCAEGRIGHLLFATHPPMPSDRTGVPLNGLRSDEASWRARVSGA